VIVKILLVSGARSKGGEVPRCSRRRASAKREKAKEAPPIDEEARAILKALSKFKKPASCSEIAEKAGLPAKKVVGKMRGLLNKGLVERPKAGVYVITAEGKKLAK